MDNILVIDASSFTLGARILIPSENYSERCDFSELATFVNKIASEKKVKNIKFLSNKKFAEQHIDEILKINKIQYSNNPLEIEVIE